MRVPRNRGRKKTTESWSSIDDEWWSSFMVFSSLPTSQTENKTLKYNQTF